MNWPQAFFCSVLALLVAPIVYFARLRLWDDHELWPYTDDESVAPPPVAREAYKCHDPDCKIHHKKARSSGET